MRAHIRCVLPCRPADVWQLVTDWENCGWRRDLERVQALPDGSGFIEYAKGGAATRFHITTFVPMERCEMELENPFLQGRWLGLFRTVDGGTELDFTEEVTIKKWYMRLPARFYLKKQQAAYIADLSAALQRATEG